MRISVNNIRLVNKIYSSAGEPASEGVDHLVRKIGDQLGAVEEVIPFGERFDGVVVAKVVACDQHPNADRLHVCKVDDGGRTPDLERDENGHVQVVCGAPNVREGLKVAWLPPGATVPSTFNDAEPFVLDARELRGVKSNGMMASPKELTIGDSHEGIMELDTEAEPGTLFAEAYNLVGEAIIDMENKMFTHRPDCFGQLGIAREIEGIYNRPYKSPDWYRVDPEFPNIEAEELPLEVRNELPELVPRFTAITMCNVTIKPSPVWLQILLTEMGLRPINNIVDYTNYFMLETGQPLHAYDYDKVKALCDADHAVLSVRYPKTGEKIALLNGKEIEPRSEAIMIATDRQLIGVGGAMGGADTEVDANTRNIILECANFDMYSIRRTSMAHGLFTDAVTRFNKGQSPLQNLAVLAKVVDEIRRYADGKVASLLVDDNHLSNEVLENGSVHPPVTVTSKFINDRLGWKLSAQEITTLLTNVEFKVQQHDDKLVVGAPFWRTDIEIPEDIVEEVGRLNGYDKLPLQLPKRDIMPAVKNPLLELKAKMRQTLTTAGANELLTYSFVHGDLFEKVGQDGASAFQLSNALSPDLQYYRLSIVPSLLDRIHPNIKSGYKEIALFEIGKSHQTTALDEDGLPLEFDNLGFVYSAAESESKGAAYYEARKFLDHLASSLGVEFDYLPLPNHTSQMDAPFELSRSASVCLRGSTTSFGIIGELSAAVRKRFKLPERTAAFEVGIGALLAANKSKTYKSLPRFPYVEQDLCLKVPADTPYATVFEFVSGHLHANRPDQTHHKLSPLDIYQREGSQEYKQITLRLQIASFERTLTAVEVNNLLESVAAAAQQQLKAEKV
ncbi:MAG TPA: phenylalanine--tRNA ligase subunit beta [Patescibacteria group bacterium]|nr:phenylalanine--tRNA ligase subunit beta [Patescibacteria group bacterium]